MKLFIMRHAEAEYGEQLDPTRQLTSVGLNQIEVMSDFMVRQVGRVDLVLSSWFQRAHNTAIPMAKALGDAPIDEIATLDPDGKVSDAWSDIQNLAETHQANDVLVVTHHPLTNELIEFLCGAKTNEVHFKHGFIIHIEDGLMHWMLGPPQVERDDEGMLDAAIKVAESALRDMGARFDEAKGEYFYDLTLVKRVTEGASASGTCEYCEDNIDAGFIDADDVYPSGDDGPPFHENCVCLEEYKEKRVRVYV